jgi:hypothetical protein
VGISEVGVLTELGPVETSIPERWRAILESHGSKELAQQLTIHWCTAQVEVGARLERRQDRPTGL